MSLKPLVTACAASSLPFPTLFGAQFLSLEANLISRPPVYVVPGAYPNHGLPKISHSATSQSPTRIPAKMTTSMSKSFSQPPLKTGTIASKESEEVVTKPAYPQRKTWR